MYANSYAIKVILHNENSGNIRTNLLSKSFEYVIYKPCNYYRYWLHRRLHHAEWLYGA